MKLNVSVILEELTHLGIKTCFSGNTRHIIDNFEILAMDREESEENILYIIPPNFNIASLKKDFIYIGFLDEFSDTEPNCIYIDTSPDILKLISNINLIFAKYNKWEQSLIKLVQDGGSVNDLIAISTDIFNNSIIVYDNSLRLIGIDKNAELYNELDKKLFYDDSTSSWYMNDSTFQESKDVGTFDFKNMFIARNYEPHLFMCPIFVNKVKVGFFTIPLYNEINLENYIFLADVFAYAVSSVIEKEYSVMDRNFKNSIFPIDIIKGKIKNKATIQHYCKLLNFEPDNTFFILSFRPANEKTDILKDAIHYGYAVKKIFSNSMTSVIDKNFVAIIHSKYETIRDVKLKELNIFCELNHLKCGISMPFTDFSKAPEYYIQSVEAINYAKNYFAFYENHFHNHIISIFNQQFNSKEFIHPYVKILQNNDPDGVLRQTLLEYLICDRSHNQCSVKLNIHKSTLKYRLDRIKDLYNDEDYLSDQIRVSMLMSLEISLSDL